MKERLPGPGREAIARRGSLVFRLVDVMVMFVIAGGLLLTALRLTGDEDEQSLILLVAALPLAAAAGFLVTMRRRESSFASMGLAGFGGALAAVLTFGAFPEAGIASELYRTLLVYAPFAALGYVVGSAVAYVAYGSGKFDMRISYESFISVRYLQSLRGSVLSIVTVIALVGCVLGTALLIVGLAVLSGFEADLVDKIIGAHAHMSVTKYPGYLMDREDEAKARVEAKKLGALHGAAYVAAEVAIASDSNHTEARMYGIDPIEARPVFAVLNRLVKGNAEKLARQGKGTAKLAPPTQMPERAQKIVEEGDAPEARFPVKRPTFTAPSPLPGLIIGQEMARQLHVEIDDTVLVVSPLVMELTPQGEAPKTKSFRVAGIFDMRMYEFDAHYVYTLTEELQKFTEIDDQLTGVAFAFDNPEMTQKIAPKLLKALGGYPTQVQSWQEKNKNLFLSLKLEKAVAFIVLIFMVLVASFSIVNTLTMTVIEKAREIAILKTMGASDVSISKIFVIQGAIVGAAGTLIGAVFGVALALIISKVQFLVDRDVYFMDHLPIRLHPVDIMQVCALSLVLTSLSAVFPAISAAKLQPVEGLRYE
jgi:lipoprotein-releasing system permease protein